MPPTATLSRRQQRRPIKHRTTATPRQTKFVALYNSGQTLAQAYLNSGYSAKNKGTAHAQACRLLSKPVVASLLQKAKEAAANTAAASRDRRLALLASFAADPTHQIRDRIMAIRTLNEMTGDNAPTKVEVDAGPNLLATLTAAIGRIEALSPLVLRTVTGRVIDRGTAPGTTTGSVPETQLLPLRDDETEAGADAVDVQGVAEEE